MSTALQRTNSAGGDKRIERKGYGNRSMAPPSLTYNTPESCAVDRKFLSATELEDEDHGDSLSSSTTSSIGKNSDDSTTGAGGDGEEVQSEYNGGPLDNLEALEEVLPVKKSISMFYSGKSKSFTSLSDAAACPSIDDITKPENAYTRKRKNLLAFNNLMDKNRNTLSRGAKGGGISKRPNSCRSMLVLAAAAAENASEPNSGEASYSYSSSSGSCRPPLPPHVRRAKQPEPSASLYPADKLSSWRSFSLSDLHGAGAGAGEDSKQSHSKHSGGQSWIINGHYNTIK